MVYTKARGFAARSYQKEMLDADGIPAAEIARNLRELDTINTLLGGHRTTLSGFRALLRGKKSVSVCEIGCGGGDNLRSIGRWCRKKNIGFSCTGVDINPACIAFAGQVAGIDLLITADYRSVAFNSHRPDIVFSSLFCHHFDDEELVGMLQWMQRNAKTGFLSMICTGTRWRSGVSGG